MQKMITTRDYSANCRAKCVYYNNVKKRMTMTKAAWYAVDLTILKYRVLFLLCHSVR